jgi:hypothetical protein
MDVTSLTGLLIFALVLLPAATFRLTAERSRSAAKRSEFDQTLYALVTGLLIAVAAALILVALRAVSPAFYPSPARLVEGSSTYLSTHLWPTARTALQYLVISNAMAVGLALILPRARGRWRTASGAPSATPHDVWSTFMIDLPPAGTKVSVAVLRDDDAVLSGTLAAVEVQDNEPTLVLGGEKFVTFPGRTAERLDDRWHFLMVRGSAVRSVALAYVSAEQTDEAGPT